MGDSLPNSKEIKYLPIIVSEKNGNKRTDSLLYKYRLAKVPGSARESYLNEIVNLKHIVDQEYIGRVMRPTLLQQQKRNRHSLKVMLTIGKHFVYL